MKEIRHKVLRQGASISAYEWGDRNKPAILFLHGYPDTHDVWDFQIQALAQHYHVLAFDLRGVGESSRNGKPFEYRIKNILKDIDAVASNILGADASFHLVGHDWGSVLGWSYVLHPVYSKKVNSWVSISGPHLGLMLRSYLACFLNPFSWFNKVPSITGEEKYQLAEIMRTFRKYASFFPVLARVRFSSDNYQAVNQRLVRYGYPEGDASLPGSSKELKNRFFNTINLYLTNIPFPPAKPKKRSCKVPSLLIVPKKDEFVRPWLFDSYNLYVRNMQIFEIDAPHWVQRTHPEKVTQFIKSFVEENHSENNQE